MGLHERGRVTLNFTNTGSALAARVFSLALKGVNVKPGSFLKATGAAPATQAITGVGFRPNLVMLANVQGTASAAPVVHSRFGLGASDGTTEGSSAFQDQDAAGIMATEAIDKTSKVFVKVDNSTPVINAEANLTTFGTDGFTLNWTTNDAVQTRILYLSMAPLAVPEVRLISFTASREARGVHLSWHTGSEVDNLGFHLYREIDGQRTRITRSLVAGSGLMVGSRSRVTNEQKYSRYWDAGQALLPRHKRRIGSQNVDFNGKSTWHGPVRPVSNVIGPPASPADNSPTLGGLGHGVGHSEERFLTSPEPGLATSGAAVAARSSRMAVVASAITPADARQAQWAIASQQGVKIGVRVRRVVQGSQPTLEIAAGLDPNVDPATLHLFLGGIEQPILVTGAVNDPSIRLTSSNSTERVWTLPSPTRRCTSLTRGTGAGLRVQTAPVVSPGPAAAARFWGTVKRKNRAVYFAALRNGDAENWFGEVLSDALPTDLAVTVQHPDSTAPSDATLEVILQGVTQHRQSRGPSCQSNRQRHRRRRRELRGPGPGRGDAHRSARTAVRRDEHRAARNAGRYHGLQHVRYAPFGLLAHERGRRRQVAADGCQSADGDDPRFASRPVRVVDISDLEAVLELPVTALPLPSSAQVQTPGTGTRSLLAFTEATIAVACLRGCQPALLAERGNQCGRLSDHAAIPIT